MPSRRVFGGTKPPEGRSRNEATEGRSCFCGNEANERRSSFWENEAKPTRWILVLGERSEAKEGGVLVLAEQTHREEQGLGRPLFDRLGLEVQTSFGDLRIFTPAPSRPRGSFAGLARLSATVADANQPAG